MVRLSSAVIHKFTCSILEYLDPYNAVLFVFLNRIFRTSSVETFLDPSLQIYKLWIYVTYEWS